MLNAGNVCGGMVNDEGSAYRTHGFRRYIISSESSISREFRDLVNVVKRCGEAAAARWGLCVVVSAPYIDLNGAAAFMWKLKR
jgi:hypothetical protein